MNESLVSDGTTSVSFDEGIEEIEKHIDQGSSKIHIEGLREASRALFLVRLVRSISKPVVVLTPNQNIGERLIGDIKYFCKYENVKKTFRYFPSWGILPYENISPSSEIMGERLEVLHQLQRNEISLLVVPVDSFMQCVIPRHELSDQTFSFEIG